MRKKSNAIPTLKNYERESYLPLMLPKKPITTSEENNFKVEKVTKRKNGKLRKVGKVVKRTALVLLGTLTIAVSVFLVWSKCKADDLNSGKPSSNPFNTDNVFDNNGNDDLEVGDDGQIVIDPMTEEQKQILLNQIHTDLLLDANNCSTTEISQIKDILSISLLPYNLCEEDNEFDKYYLSFLFVDDKDIPYSMNYITGSDFQATSESKKDVVFEYLDYLRTECAPDTCATMDEGALQIQSATSATFVGETYVGYDSSGDKTYNIPIHNEDGVIVYSATANPIDSYGLNPSEVLLEELSQTNGDHLFIANTLTSSEKQNEMLSIIKELTGKNADNKSSSSQNEEQKNEKQSTATYSQTYNQSYSQNNIEMIA